MRKTKATEAAAAPTTSTMVNPTATTSSFMSSSHKKETTNRNIEQEQPRDSVFEEGMELLVGAVIIYLFAELRDMVREGSTNTDNDDAAAFSSSLPSLDALEPPLTATRLLQLLQDHKTALQERAGEKDHAYLESRLSALQQAYASPHTTTTAARETREPESSSSLVASLCSLEGLFSVLCGGGKNNNSTPTTSDKAVLPSSTQDGNSSMDIQLHEFVDHKAQEEIVHAIVINPSKRRITVVFRGSVTNKDFLQDAKCAQKSLSNPVYELLQSQKQNHEDKKDKDTHGMPSTMRIHTGFWEYLFHPTTTTTTTSDDTTSKTTTTRMDDILASVKDLLKQPQYSNFSLYMTGHSLGGALSTLCGFYAACDEELMQLTGQGRVVIYSVASPYCGNWKFRHGFCELERLGRIQHLRMANKEDLVTLMPFAVPKATILSPALSLMQGAGNLYKHVGIHLRMERLPEPASTPTDVSGGGGPVQHTLRYPRENQLDSNDSDLAQDLQNALDSGKSLIQSLYLLCKSEFSTVERFHSCDEYEERFETCRQALSQVTLDDLYQNPEITGKLFATTPPLVPMNTSSGLNRTMRAWKFLQKKNSNASTNSTATEMESTADDVEEMTLTEAAMASPAT